ncbi:MAG: hypothetical protein UR28_C0014G0012 [Candidatus Peregrinibacteria bacterium GW2011_GWF2_33_10]|nr:MAG: hypothetical protein UR28_C0014G0012 [Candidatus Peregrinibacteria bacterium GW2011_GWF2_33_10]OGJ45154.1 MAG: hypothetical protein A2263_05385 [Candidatus Peregrinibacteria bacterium RIFOXYA2_FULL_33_21]OGJ46302.1 MAG: hypothetical protein A2272_03415 [Candidatus Peregrinibacteria bacterium RIFOXYA12_FULL_33_12]OGJ50823.1 MAG: hypothetical protein A2307_02155 [Candidatus Peregrinibacteria bacterium RIFOXYB2_FULL_33_20]
MEKLRHPLLKRISLPVMALLALVGCEISDTTRTQLAIDMASRPIVTQPIVPTPSTSLPEIDPDNLDFPVGFPVGFLDGMPGEEIEAEQQNANNNPTETTTTIVQK